MLPNSRQLFEQVLCLSEVQRHIRARATVSTEETAQVLRLPCATDWATICAHNVAIMVDPEQHRLAHPAQPGQHQRALGAPAGDPLEHDVEGAQLLVAPGQLGRSLAGAGGVGVAHGVHDRTVSGSLALAAYIASES